MNMPFLTMQALLGTDKRPPELPADDSEPGRLTQAIAATRDGSENAEALRLLRAAGVQAVCGLAGYQPPRADSALPEPCPPEPRASVDKAAVIDVLRQVLSSGSDRMRLEAFRLMLGARKVLPPALLPQALELGRRTPSLRGPIALIAGERGRWLGGRNAAWNLFATNAENELDPEVWDNGTLMQREAYLKSLRAQDPAKARERFETASASFDARERAAFTGCLGEGLSAADEAFLETLLEKDRSKEVRQAAASLLVRLPESGYVRRMGERLAACIVVPEARGGLIGRIASAFSAPLPAVEPPESFDPEWKKDLLEEKKPQYEEFGPRAWWLYQIGRCTPLAWWEAHTGLSPEALIDWAQKTDWRNVLLRSWLEAARCERHAAWASALLAHVFKEQIEISVGKGRFSAFAFIGLLPPPEREAALLERFPCPGSAGGGATFAQQHYKQVMQFGQFAASEWEGDATFSLEGGHSLVRRIRFWADHSDGIGQISYQTSIALGHIIEATFWLIPVSLLDDLLEGWPHGENGAPFCRSGYDFLTTSIRTRKALHQYFA